VRYVVLIEKAASNYSAYLPDLPGCVATGATLEETLANMRSAIEMHVEGLREDRQPVPEPSTIAEYVEVAF
jgi:predicted RNase H-like HicB family nuclease